MSRIKHVCVTLLTLLATVFLTACGDDGGSNATQAYVPGDYEASSIVLSSWTWNDVDTVWEYEYYTLEQVSLTIKEDGVRGTAMVASVQADADNEDELTTVGDEVNDWTVGDEVQIRGRVDGSVISLRLTSESGGEAVSVFVVYDGEVSDFNADLEFATVDTMAGTAHVEGGANTYASTDVYLYDLSWTSAANSTPNPVNVELPTGVTSIYADGDFIGSMDLYLTVYDESANEFDYVNPAFDVDVTVSGQTITGSATLEDVDDDDVTGVWEGFDVGQVFTLTGTISGSAIEWELAANGFAFPILSAPYDFASYDIAPGSIDTIDVEYGAAYDTQDNYGGEVEFDLSLD